MGVRGLFTYLNQEPGNFTNGLLHNTYVVIDARNYSASYYREAKFPCQYGGEYLNFFVRVRAELRQLQKCRITPIFVFDGCHESKGSKREKLLNKNKEFIGEISQLHNLKAHADPDSLNQTTCSFLPRLIHQVFISVLDEFGMHHITCEREADLHVAELAVYLNCPVVSNDSDFFLFSTPPNSGYRVVPLEYLEKQCKPVLSRCDSCGGSTGCYGLPCKFFKPSQSVFGKIDPHLLPLLPVLVGNDFISSVPLPAKISCLINSSSRRGLSYNGKRIQAVVTWLSSFSKDVSIPVREILSLIQGKNLNEMTGQIIGCIRGYALDLHGVCQQLVQFLSLPNDEKVGNVEISSRVRPPTSAEANISSLENAITAVTNALLSQNLRFGSEGDEYGVIRGWPEELTKKFRKGGMLTCTLDSLYVPDGAVLRVLIENIRLPESVYFVTEAIRRLEYRLLIHLEHKRGYAEKLCASDDGQPVETRRCGMEMCRFKLNVSPLAFPPTKPLTTELIDTFLKEHLEIELNQAKENDTKSLTLISVLVFWFRHSRLARSNVNRLRDCSVALSLITCLLIVSASLKSFGNDKAMPDCFTSELDVWVKIAGDNLKQHCSKAGKVELSIEVVHQLAELQLVYEEFHQLIDIMDILYIESQENSQISTSKKLSEDLFTFLPEWIMFPSGRLLHWLAISIELSAPTDRFHQVQEKWIPYLLNSFPELENINSQSLVDQLKNVFLSADRMLLG